MATKAATTIPVERMTKDAIREELARAIIVIDAGGENATLEHIERFQELHAGLQRLEQFAHDYQALRSAYR